jgi:molecular chaperone GrpE
MSTNGSEPAETPPGLPAGTPEPAESPSERAEDDAGEPDTAELNRQLGETKDRLLRTAADFENFKRRASQERADSVRYSSEEAARALLPILDDLRRAVEHAPDGGTGDVLGGLQLVVREFESALERLGITPVPAVGEAFDPALHEAIGGEESDDVVRDTVVAEIQPGYRLHDRLIRPALVRVAHPRHPIAPG